MLTLRQLDFLVAVADTLNFSRAAERCLVTQPTLSAGIQELEARLGVQLLERTKRSVVLTQAGAEIAGRARGILREVGEIAEVARSHSDPRAGDLRLGAIPTVGPFLIPRGLPALRAQFPDLRLFLREELTEQLLAGLRDGRLDVILIALPFDIGPLETLHLFDDGYHLAAPDFEPVHDPLRLLQDGSRLMLLEKGHCLQRHALEAFPERDLSRDDSFSATSLGTLLAMVSEGLGVTLLPDLAIDSGVADHAGVQLTPLPQACPRHVVLAWRRNSARRALFEEMGGVLRRTRAAMRPLADSSG